MHGGLAMASRVFVVEFAWFCLGVCVSVWLEVCWAARIVVGGFDVLATLGGC